MKSTAKAEACLRDLADKLALRFPTKTIRQARDANAWPMLIVSASGNEAAGQSVIAIRMSAADAVSKDVFGNALTAFAPHTVEVAYELTAADNPIPSDADLFKTLYEVFKIGAKTQLKEIANATAVSEASMNAAAVAAEVEDLHWPTKSV
jgi:hypothetical protein